MLADLGRALNSAIAGLNGNSAIDEAALDLSLRSIAAALLSSDVNVLLVKKLRESVKGKVLPQLVEIAKKSGDNTAGQKGKAIIQKAVFDELVDLVDPGEGATPPFKPVKGKIHVLMMVGMQGAGKTTTCTKLAVHYQKRGLKVALVCADTFRAGAFDQLKQNAVKARVPFFGSYTETDPVAIALQGVSKFRSERFDLIILDTSGRHLQETELFEEMVEIGRVVKPDCTIMVLDGAMGQAAEAQSRAFKEASDFGAIIVTKLDGHAKGGGAISAVAATSCPIIFIGTGEHLHDLETFSPRPFISKMLGMGDMQGLMESAKEMQELNPGRQEKMMEKFEKGEFSVRDMREQMMNIMSMGPLSKLTSMIPGMSGMMSGNEDDIAKKQKRMVFIFDSMTAEELDSDGSLFLTPSPHSPIASTSQIAPPSPASTKANKGKVDISKNGKEKATPPVDPPLAEGIPREPNARVLRVARGSGTSVQEVEEVLGQHQMFKGMVKKAGGKSGWMAKMAQGARAGGAGGGMPGMPGMGMPGMGGVGMPDLANMTPESMAAMLPPGMRAQMQAPGAMEAMKAMMGGAGGMGGGGFDMAKMMAMMGKS